MISSDQDTISDSSNTASSPRSFMESPQSSPSQLVPQLGKPFNIILTGSGGSILRHGNAVLQCEPYLHITEQPQDHFRFRYRSELAGTHGCLQGVGSNSTIKTYPSVKLCNYIGSAIVRCQLAQINNENDHPHQLLLHEEDRDVSAIVCPEQGYEVRFPDVGIIHTAKKNVVSQLLKQYTKSKSPAKQLKARLENEAKQINLNIVRLKFSAHDVETDREICSPVFSQQICNMKSAETNDLRICRISKVTGRVQGREDVFVFVEKVKRKNIEIHFQEVNPNGKVIWTGKAEFMPSEVHYQYGIVFRTPEYHNLRTPTDVKVSVYLFRPSDERKSNPIEFTYKADHAFKQSKKRKANSYYSSDGFSSGSLKSSELPIPVQLQHTSGKMMLSDAIFEKMTHLDGYDPTIPGPHPISLNSMELDKMLVDNTLSSGDMRRFLSAFDSADFKDYLKEGINMEEEEEYDIVTSFEKLKANMNLVPDSGIPKLRRGYTAADHKASSCNNTEAGHVPYKAYYTQANGAEVKKLIKEVCDIIRNKGSDVSDLVLKQKVNRMFEIRLDNGDTFLHMTLRTDGLVSVQFLVQLIHQLRQSVLLNSMNDRSQTILHYAIMYDLPNIVPYLISKGCDPKLEDCDGNNAVHYAVIYNNSLSEVLASIRANKVDCDLNAYNRQNQTALHIAAELGQEESCQKLLDSGADYSIVDRGSRTPLHLAAYDQQVQVMRVLLKHIPRNEVDMNSCGYTALQIVCGGKNQENSYLMATMLLDCGASPLNNESNKESALKLTLDKPELKKLLESYLPPSYVIKEDDIKSEPEEDYDSADDAEYSEMRLDNVSLYSRELSEVLDRTSRWKELAVRLKCDSLLNWYEKTDSPTMTLLTQIKEVNENFSSKSLALMLMDMGETEAANVILKHIS